MSFEDTYGGNTDRKIRKITRTISSTTTGSVLKMSRFLGSSSTFSLEAGTNANITLVNGNEINVVSPITADQTQNAILKETVGSGVDNRIVEYGISINSKLQVGPSSVSFHRTVANGSLIANITGVPSGSTPSISPNDGRIVVSGDEGSGWKLTRGSSAVVAGSYTFSLTAAGALSTSLSVTITIDTTAPTITSSSSINVNENAHLSHTLTANEDVTWSISGIDVSHFTLTGNTLTWNSDSTKDYEIPTDSDTNNVYQIVVTATDLAGNITNQNFQVAVQNVDDVAPIITSINAISVDENSTLFHVLTANEPISSWSIAGGADSAQFSISGNVLRWVGDGTKDYDAPSDVGSNNIYNVTVQATDTSGNTQTQAIAVTVIKISAGHLVGDLPSLPSTGGTSGFGYDVLISESGSNTTNATNYKAAITSAVSGTTKYIAIEDGITIDLGSTNYTNATTGTVNNTAYFISKDLVIAPKSWYSGKYTFITDPFGDGKTYSRMLDRKYTIVGWQAFNGGNVKFYGAKRTMNLMPTAPTSTTFQSWRSIGVDDNPINLIGSTSTYLDNYVGSGTCDIAWNEYYIGKDVNHTPFDPTEKLFDYTSPAWWAQDYENGGIQESGGYFISTTAGSTTITVTSKKGGWSIQPGHKITSTSSTGTLYLQSNTTVLPYGTNGTTGTGDTGTYEISLPALVTASNAGSTFAVYRGDDSNGGWQGWGDTTFAKFNRFYGMPSAIGVGDVSSYNVAFTGSSAKVRYNYIHDVFDGVRVSNENLGSLIECTDNYLTRNYNDNTRFNWVGPTTIPRVTFERNIITLPVSNSRDNGNPHSDSIQSYDTGSNQSTPTAVPGWYGQNNLVGIPDYCRGSLQNFFQQGTNNYYWLGMKFSNNLGLGVNKMIAASQRSSLIKYNIGITQDTPRPNNDTTYANWTSSILTGRPSSTVENGVVVLKDNISEYTDAGTTASYILKEGSNIDGFGISGTTKHGNLATTTFTNLNRTCSTVNDMFLALKERQAGITAGITHSSLSSMMSSTDDGEIRADFIPLGGFDINTTISSGTSYVHGPYGTSLTVTPASGVTWEAIDPHTGSTTRAMGSGSGTITCGSLMRIGGTSSSTSLTQKDLSVDLSGVTSTFSSYTKSSTFFGTADNQSTAWSRFNSPAPSGTFVGFVIALIGLKVDSWPASGQKHALGDTTFTSAKGRISISSLTGGPMLGNFFGTTASGGSAPRWDISKDTTNRFTFLMSCDLTQLESNPDQVFKLMKDYSRVYLNASNSTINSNGGTKTFTSSDFFGTTGWGVFGTHVQGAGFDGSMQGLHISLYTNSADIPDIENISVINGYTADMINATTANIPGVTDSAAFKLLYQGSVSSWNAGIAGVGSSTITLSRQGANLYA